LQITEFRATADAERAWSACAAMMRLYREAGLEGFAAGKWREELGVVVQGVPSDPTGLLDYILSAVNGMEELRCQSKNAYLLLDNVIEYGAPHTENGHYKSHWWNDRLTGIGDILNLDRVQARRLYEGGKAWMFYELEHAETPDDVFDALT
jgi:hypothetical protein